MVKRVTKIQKISINKFRGLKDVTIDFGSRITVICGKNGTSKSTILGAIAQVFSFRKNYSIKPAVLLNSYKTLTDVKFESNFSDHFRFSEKFDKPGTMDIGFEIYDGYFNKTLKNINLKLYDTKGRNRARPIVRGNDAVSDGNTSRNVTHPVIFLSLARLLPITLRPNYSVRNVEYLKTNENYFKGLNGRLLLKAGANNITATTGTINSVVAHSDSYDQDSVSVGEDNVGQILQALLSFKKLKEEYEHYKGGILLIDEADAGLFPAAQIEFISLLSKITKELDLQIIITSHSPTMIEEIFNLSKLDSSMYRTVYLTDTYGDIKAMEQFSWREIYADLRVETIKLNDNYFPKVNVYFEDVQGYDFYKAIITESKVKKVTNNLNDINMSCSDLINLVMRKIPEFSQKSIIIFDADVKQDKNIDKISHSNICFLPSELPPDQLLFEFLFNLDDDDNFWRNEYQFTKAVFRRCASPIIEKLDMNKQRGETLHLQAAIDEFRRTQENHNGLIRDMFKKFAKDENIINVVEGKVSSNPYRYWAKLNSGKAEAFKVSFIKALSNVLIKGHGFDAALVNSQFKYN